MKKIDNAEKTRKDNVEKQSYNKLCFVELGLFFFCLI